MGAKSFQLSLGVRDHSNRSISSQLGTPRILSKANPYAAWIRRSSRRCEFVAAIARRSHLHVRIGDSFGGDVNIGNFESGRSLHVCANAGRMQAQRNNRHRFLKSSSRQHTPNDGCAPDDQAVVNAPDEAYLGAGFTGIPTSRSCGFRDPRPFIVPDKLPNPTR